jgi:hypothetical protein
VAFGFRALGQDVDGGVDDGPYWEVLTAFAEDPSFYTANDAGTLVCGPMAAEVADDDAFDQARRKIDAINEPVEWYFTLAAETSVARAPGGTGAPVGKVGTVALPLIGFYPPEKEGAPRRRRPISRYCCLPAAPAGCRFRPCVRSRLITSATLALRPANGRSPVSTRARLRPEDPG